MARSTEYRTGSGSAFGYGSAGTDAWMKGLGEAPYAFNPQTVGGNIGQYYTAALAEQPGYPAILRNIAGMLSPEEKYAIGQGAAERGIGIGSYGAGNDATALLRALGLTSRALTEKGLQQYGAAYSAVPALSPATQFLSPSDRAQIEAQARLQSERLAAEAALQKERLASGEKVAGWGESTRMYGLRAEERWAEVNRADKLAALEQRLTGKGTGTSATGITTGGTPVVWRGSEYDPSAGIPPIDFGAGEDWGKVSAGAYGEEPGYYG